MEKKPKKILNIIGDVVFFVAIGFVALFALCNGLDRHSGYKFPFFGTRSSVIISPSMSVKNSENTYLTDDMEQIQVNDVITTKMEKYDDIEIFDVVTFYSNKSLICHRVIDKYTNEQGQFLVTRGDANNADDEPVNFTMYRGTLVKVTRGGGRVVGFFQSPYFYLALFGTVFFAALGFFIYDSGIIVKLKLNKLMVKQEKSSQKNDKKEN